MKKYIKTLLRESLINEIESTDKEKLLQLINTKDIDNVVLALGIADSQGIEFKYGEIDLSGADLEGIDLSGVNFQGAKLYRAELENANLSGANLQGADLRGADLWNTVFSGALNVPKQ